VKPFLDTNVVVYAALSNDPPLSFQRDSTCPVLPPLILHDGQIAHACHARFARRANLPQGDGFALSPKSRASSAPSRTRLKRGASRSSRTLSAGCDGRDDVAHARPYRRAKRFVSGRGVQDERHCCGRRSRVVLASVADAKSRGGQRPNRVSGGHSIREATVAKRNSSPGRSRINRKTIAWGMPDVSGASAVNTGVHTQLHKRTPGCGCIGHPAFPAPSVSKGR
jgi:hypothetical protein